MVRSPIRTCVVVSSYFDQRATIPARQCRGGDGDSDGQWAEREPDHWIAPIQGTVAIRGTVAITFSQVASATPQTATVSVPVSYPAVQTAGDLNVVVVGWNDNTSRVQSVEDSAGNTYTLAVGPTVGTGLEQSIYYSANIVGGSNTVTVTFSQAAAYPDVRILEYKGVTALDVTAGASGSSATANSGAATTTVANELIFGANTVATLNGTAGSGFTSRIMTAPDGDLAEDKIVTAAGSNSATATLTGSGPWVMQMATFLAVIWSGGDGEQRHSRERNDGRWDGGDHHRNELCRRSDGDVRGRGGDQRCGGERDVNHGDGAGRSSRSRDGNGDQSGRAERESRDCIYVYRAASGV